MEIYHFEPDSLRFAGAGVADPSPLEPGKFLLPAYSTEIAPPVFDALLQECRFIGGEWSLSEITQAQPEQAETDPAAICAAKLFSPGTKGLYSFPEHSGIIPADAVEIAAELFEQLLADQSAGATIQADENGLPFAVFPTLSEQITAICQQVDTEADAARLKIAGDPLRVVEYERAATEAQAFKDTGYTGATPPTVASWAEAKNWTAQQAADDILAVSAAWNAALYALRDIRLKGKEAIKAAVDAETATAAATAASDQVKAVLAAMGL